MRQPWFRFFPADWIVGVVSLTAAERGVYISILALIYDHNGPIELDDRRLARACGVPVPNFRLAVERLICTRKLTLKDGLLSNDRAIEECQERQKFRAMARNRTASGWEKRKQKQRGIVADALHKQNQSQKVSVSVEGIPSTDIFKPSSETLVKTPLNGGDVLPLVIPQFKDDKERRKNDVDLCQDVVADWNALAADLGLPGVRDITPARQAAIKARGIDFEKTYDFSDPKSGFKELMDRVRRSPFLRGEVRDFRCDFDFIVKASSFTKIMEGKYETKQKPGKLF